MANEPFIQASLAEDGMPIAAGSPDFFDVATGLTLPLMSLEEFNKRRRELHEHLSRPQPNGIACPECEKELMDDNDGIVLTSDPPQVRVHCPCCNWRGTRLV